MRTILLAAALSAMSLSAAAQPYGYGPGNGMMQGYGMHGGMMQGHGMGGPMMRGEGFAAQVEDLGLSDEQRAKILAIEKDTRGKQWQLMDQMRDLRWETRKRIEAVLTDEQRAKLREQRGRS